VRLKSAVGAGVVLATLAAGGAQAATPELSVDQRLEDRREVAAGTRAQVLGFQDGRFYANGWHITGEMGGIVTPPLKLLDSVSFRVGDTWVPPATRFTAGAGYARFTFPSVGGLGVERVDVAPDGRRGALLGLKLTNPKKGERTVVQADVTQVSLAKSSRGIWIGAAAGGGGGLVAGLGLGTRLGNESGGDFNNLKPAIAAACAGVGALIGAAIGAAIGVSHRLAGDAAADPATSSASRPRRE